MDEPGRQVIRVEDDQVRERGLARVTTEQINRTIESLNLLKEKIPSLLQPDIDYGHVTGIQGQMLKDPGASNIINFFNAYPGERRILHLRDDGMMIAVCVEVPLISRETGQVIGSGTAAASTEESRYKNRWVENPLEYGYTEEDIKNWKKKDLRIENGKKQYKIKNPDHSELLDLIIRQASKRAEADAARSLPGVGSALVLLLEGKGKPRAKTADRYSKPEWQKFYGELAKMGISYDEVHQKLGVKSLNSDWLAKGRSLDEAIVALRQMGDAATAPGQANPAKPPATPSTANSVTPEMVTNLGQLFHVCEKIYGLKYDVVLRELNVTAQQEITETPWECWQRIMGARE